MLTLYQINNIIHSNVSCNVSHKIMNTFMNKCFIYSFISEFYKNNEIFDKCTIIAALIYMSRYNKICKITYSNIKPVLETCLILANKYCSDLEIEDSGPLEAHLLNVIEWNLYISEKEYNEYKKVIKSITNLI